jgi:hypothetical protein
MGHGRIVGRKLSGLRKDKEKGKKQVGWVGLKGGRERERVWFPFFRKHTNSNKNMEPQMMHKHLGDSN